MPDFNDLLHSEEAARLMQDKHTLENLQKAPETRKLLNMLSRSTGGDLEGAANAAVQGDTARLMDAMGKLLRDPEGQKLMEQISKAVRK